jgi:hypothetical protein
LAQIEKKRDSSNLDLFCPDRCTIELRPMKLVLVYSESDEQLRPYITQLFEVHREYYNVPMSAVKIQHLQQELDQTK